LGLFVGEHLVDDLDGALGVVLAQPYTLLECLHHLCVVLGHD